MWKTVVRTKSNVGLGEKVMNTKKDSSFDRLLFLMEAMRLFESLPEFAGLSLAQVSEIAKGNTVQQWIKEGDLAIG